MTALEKVSADKKLCSFCNEWLLPADVNRHERSHDRYIIMPGSNVGYKVSLSTYYRFMEWRRQEAINILKEDRHVTTLT